MAKINKGGKWSPTMKSRMAKAAKAKAVAKATSVKKAISVKKAPVVDLPPDINPSDTQYHYAKGWVRSEVLDPMGLGWESGFTGTLTFYKTERFGWVLCTLSISKGRKYTNQTDRTYGITVKDESLVSVGKGPHVTAKVEVFLSKLNFERIKKYLELWKKGMGKAGDTRDRISSRRANTISRRGSINSWW